MTAAKNITEAVLNAGRFVATGQIDENTWFAAPEKSEAVKQRIREEKAQKKKRLVNKRRHKP